VRIRQILFTVIAGLLLLVLILPQSVLAAGPVIVPGSVFVIPGSTTAMIYWTVLTNSTIIRNQVNYGQTPALGTILFDTSNVTNPHILLTGLDPDTKYYFMVTSTDYDGCDSSGNYSFRTLAAGYSLTLTPACGVCGELTEVTTCNEVIGYEAVVAAAGTYHICWDSPAAWNPTTATGTVDTFTTSGPASYNWTFYLPLGKKGDHTVYLTDEFYNSKATATFTVYPSVKIDPAKGPVGTNVTLNGYGFAASQDVQIKFKDAVIATTTADTMGSWNATYTIPDTPAGGYNFKVEAKEGTVWAGYVEKYFKVTPSIIVTPGSGTVGQTIGVSGKGFASKEEDIEVTFDGEVVKKNILPADENGSWSTVIAVPPRQYGSYTIDASGALTRARDVPDFSFRVLAGVSVTPNPAYVGDNITVTGGGFEPRETGITVTFEGQVVAAGIIADLDGCWDTSFTLPTSTYGSHTVSASGDITQPAVTTNLATQAKIIELSSDKGAPGDSVSLTGNGFHGSQELTVTIGGIEAAGNMSTQPNGNVVISFRVPKGSLEGKRTLVVTDGGGAADSVNFTVENRTLSTTPLPISPKDSTLRSGKVTFKWQGVTGGTSYTYTLEISKTTGSANIWSRSGITESSYTLTDTETVTETLPKGTYYWRVKIVDDYDNESAWSDYIKFTVSPIPTWVWVVVGLVVLVVLMVVAYRETKFKVTE
jgi:hypothetical protein